MRVGAGVQISLDLSRLPVGICSDYSGFALTGFAIIARIQIWQKNWFSCLSTSQGLIIYGQNMSEFDLRKMKKPKQMVGVVSIDNLWTLNVLERKAINHVRTTKHVHSKAKTIIYYNHGCVLSTSACINIQSKDLELSTFEMRSKNAWFWRRGGSETKTWNILPNLFVRYCNKKLCAKPPPFHIE